MNNTYIYKNFLRLSLALFACMLMIVPSLASVKFSSTNSNILCDSEIVLGAKPETIHSEPIKNTDSILRSSGRTGLIVENTINIGDLQKEPPVRIDDIMYTNIMLPGYSYTSEVGKPRIPFAAETMAIPDSVGITLKILNSVYTTLDDYTIAPVPSQVKQESSDGYPNVDEVFSVDKTFYATDMFYPETIAEIKDISYIRDQRVAQIVFQPVQYNPVLHELRVYTSMQVQIEYSQAADLEIKNVGPYEGMCSDLIMNYDVSKIPRNEQNKNTQTELGSVSYPSDLLDHNNSADYLIITSDPFYTVPHYPPTVQITRIQPLRFNPNGAPFTGKVALIQGTAQDPAHDSIEWVQLRVMNDAHVEINNKLVYFNNNHGNVSWSCCMDIAPIPDPDDYYYIDVTASNGECTSEALQVIAGVEDGFLPVAQPSPKYQEVEVGQTVSFDGSGSFDPDTIPITNYTWLINGTTLYGMAVNYTFTQPGSYEVSLNVSSGGGPFPSPVEYGFDTCNVSVVEPPLNHPPFANATPFSQMGLINEMFTFDGSTSNDFDNDELTYSWDFGDNTPTESGSTVTHCYTAAGTYTVSLTVSDGQSSDTDTCLVLVYTTYWNKLNEFAHWRAEYSGFDVAVVNVNDLGYWADPSDPVLNNDIIIKSFIEYVYNYWSAPHMSDNHTGYILLVGDTPFVATHTPRLCPSGGHCGDHAYDRWYGCFIRDDGTGHYIGDEDYITADIMIGRFSVDDLNELYTNAEKTIQYEKNPEPGEWQKHVLLCAGDFYSGDTFSGYDFINNTLRQCQWNLSKVFYAEGGTAEEVVENISDGQTIVAYCDHGTVSEWSYLGFNINHIQQLNNTRKLPLVYSLACLTGEFQGDSDCFGEEFLNNPNGGAVAFFGASETTTGGSFEFAPSLFTSIFFNHQHIVGKIITEGITQLNSGWPEFNLLGDPALNLSLEQTLGGAYAHGPYTGVIGQPIQFTGSVLVAGDIPPSYSWTWNFGDGHKSTDQNPIYTYHHSGTYTVALTVTDSEGNTVSNITTATITPMEVHANGPYHGLTGHPVQFTGSVEGGFPQYSWHWDFGDGNTSDTQNPSYSYSYADTYSVTLTITDSEGNIAYDITTATIKLGEVFVDDDYTASTPGFEYDHFSSIQEGIDAVGEHGTVFVSAGIYHEDIVITKPLSLIGENKGSTIIDGGGGNNIAVYLNHIYNAMVKGFTIQNGTVGVKLELSSYNSIVDNMILNNVDGICLVGSEFGHVYGTEDNVISQNIISANNRGIFVKKDSSGFGVSPINNHIYHNNILNNVLNNVENNAYDECVGNFWDNGSLFGGNYWGDYSVQHPTPHDDQSPFGMWDDPYIILGNKPSSQDMYPLVHPFKLGDMNLDGVVSWRDVDPFVFAMSDSAGYQNQYHMLPTLHGDLTGDNVVNWRDIEPFIVFLNGG